MTGRAAHGTSEDSGRQPSQQSSTTRGETDNRGNGHDSRDPTGTGSDQSGGSLELLVVGTFAGGGIHRYIDEQVARLDGMVSVETHDMYSPPIGGGWIRFVSGFLLGIVALLSFPFRDRPTIAHIHTSHQYSFYRASPYVLFAKHVWDVPVILHVHGSSFDDFVQTDSRLVARLQRTVFEASDEIIVLSEFWKETLSARADSSRIRVLPNAVDPSTFPVEEDQTEDVGESVPHVVFVSNLIERKGVPELAGALERLAETHPGQFRVSIAGDGPLRERIEELASIHEEITCLGYVSEERKRSLLAEGSIYVLPTFAEGLPIAMLEGMAGANAVVTTGVGSIPEVIDDERGLLVEPGDVDALADALETLVTSHDRRSRMAANNRRAVEQEYSWDRIREELLDMYATYR